MLLERKTVKVLQQNWKWTGRNRNEMKKMSAKIIWKFLSKQNHNRKHPQTARHELLYIRDMVSQGAQKILLYFFCSTEQLEYWKPHVAERIISELKI